MTLAFNDNDRIKLTLPHVTLSLDPASATIVLLIDGTEFPCSWTDDATHDTEAGLWDRPAITNGYVAGPAVPSVAVSGATVLAYGQHTLEVVVTAGPVIKAVQLPTFWISK